MVDTYLLQLTGFAEFGMKYYIRFKNCLETFSRPLGKMVNVSKKTNITTPTKVVGEENNQIRRVRS